MQQIYRRGNEMAITRPTWKDFAADNPMPPRRKFSDQTHLEMAEGRRQRYVNSRYGSFQPRNLSPKEFANYQAWTSNFLR